MTTGAPPAPMTETSVPRFARGTRLQYDRVRQTWFIQAPERAFQADTIAAEVLQRVDGTRPLAAIIDELAQTFAAPRDIIARDVLALVHELAEKQVLLAA